MLKVTTIIFSLFITILSSLSYSGTTIKSQRYGENQVKNANKESNSQEAKYKKKFNYKEISEPIEKSKSEGRGLGGQPRIMYEKSNSGTLKEEGSDSGGGARSPRSPQ
jgi:hypothetical protein